MSADEAAALWFLVLEEGTPREANLFEEWLDQSEAHAAAWERVNAAWDCFDDAPGDEVTEVIRAAAMEVRPSARPIWPWIAVTSAAAVAGITLVTSGVLPLGPVSTGPSDVQQTASRAPLEELGEVDLETGIGERVTRQLPDGSTLHLDTDSAVDIALTPRRRLVRLVRGQAFFEVAADRTRPFSVSAGDSVVTALGTRFNVRKDATGFVVVLVKGVVEVEMGGAKRSRLRLSPGEQYVQRGETGAVSTADVEASEAWQDGFVEFDNVPLSEALVEMNRYDQRHLIVRDPEVAAYRVSGRFRTGDPLRFGRAISQIYPVRLVRQANGNMEVVRARP
ncbi:FecR family protein [Sphingomonas xinjiangensis]|uniref:Transmembrane sensor n=1 Tax=Sphingomonas xinjiangensis TaxID=643568 RepID=A0A840YS46_9SPHN|nr:FecR domain-containing protein [Sphingomonas xinjiangensis]MBB5712490.1 transmembrane sensor [Sphingomonas xinjiangensis]